MVLCVIIAAGYRLCQLQSLGLRACRSQAGRTRVSYRRRSSGAGRVGVREYQYYEFLAVDRLRHVQPDCSVRATTLDRLGAQSLVDVMVTNGQPGQERFAIGVWADGE
jgi:hypothetical protein